MENKITSYKDLLVWQKLFELAIELYEKSKMFPKEELYGITSQLRRAAFSIPSNIAEGYCRKSSGSYIQFLEIAFASGAELETWLLAVLRLHMINEREHAPLSTRLNEIMAMLNSLIGKLEKYKNNRP